MVLAEDLVEIGGRTAFRSISYALPKEIGFDATQRRPPPQKDKTGGRAICQALLGHSVSYSIRVST